MRLKLPICLHLSTLTAVITLGSSLSSAAWADTWPSKPITFVVGASAGGSSDTMARGLAKRLQESLGQAVLVDNKPAGAGLIGYGYVAKAPPDGYTFAVLSSTFTTVAATRENLQFSPTKDFKAVAMLAKGPLIVGVPANSPYMTLNDLVIAAKANPSKLNYGSAGAGSINQFATELFANAAQVKLTHIPYKGMGPAITDLLGGQIQVLVAAAPSILPQIKSGRVRALAVTTGRRSPVAPDLPTLEQLGLRESSTELWWGVLAPAGTPQAIVDKLNGEINKIIITADMKEFLFKEGTEPAPMSSTAYQTLLSAEIERWRQVAKAAGISAE